MRSFMRLFRLVLALSTLIGCHSTPPEPRAASDVQSATPVVELPLHTLLPNGSRYIVSAQPERLYAHPATRSAALAVLTEAELDLWQERIGVDVRALSHLVFGETAAGSVLILRGDSLNASFVVREIGTRMAPVESSVDGPRPRRAGFWGARRIEALTLGVHTLAIVEGSPQLAAFVHGLARRDAAERAARHEFSRCERAPQPPATPFWVQARRPLALPLDTDVGLFFAQQQELLFGLAPGDGAIDLRVELCGEFPPGAVGNLEQLAQSLSHSEMGVLLGAEAALSSLQVEGDTQALALSARLEPSDVTSGLRAMLRAQIDEIVGSSLSE